MSFSTLMKWNQVCLQKMVYLSWNDKQQAFYKTETTCSICITNNMSFLLTKLCRSDSLCVVLQKMICPNANKVTDN